MDTSTVILITIVAICLIYMILGNWLSNLKQKSFNKGYLEGQNEVVRSLKSSAYWFSAPEFLKEFNILMLYSIIYEKYQSVDFDLFRRKIVELGDRKLKDLSPEEITELIR